MNKEKFLKIKSFREYVELNDKYPEEIKAILKDEECLLYYSKLIDEEKDISFLALNGVIVEAFKKRND